MKKLVTILTFAFIAACPLVGRAQNSIESDPAYLPIDKVLDLKAMPPQVNVNLPRFLLKDAISGLTNAPNNGITGQGIDLADLVKDVKLIRVVVIEANKTNRAELERSIKALRSTLDSKWTAIVSVPNDKDGVGVYAMGDPSGESNVGLAVLVHQTDQAVIVNIVGHVSIGKLVRIAAQTHRLPIDFLKQLQGANGQTVSPESDKNVDSGSGTNQPVEAKEGKSKEAATSESGLK